MLRHQLAITQRRAKDQFQPDLPDQRVEALARELRCVLVRSHQDDPILAPFLQHPLDRRAEEQLYLIEI